MDEVVGEAALDAEVAVVGRRARRRAGHLDDPPCAVAALRVDVQIELTPDAAEIARRAHLLELALGLVAANERHLLAHGAGRADVDAAAAHLAGGVHEGQLVDGRDRRL